MYQVELPVSGQIHQTAGERSGPAIVGLEETAGTGTECALAVLGL